MRQKPTVVLIHGLFGFRKLLWLELLRPVRLLYESMGMRVLVPGLPWCASLETRAASLAIQLADEPGPLHLLGHSMGGIDARYWINHYDGAAITASLTTIASPHRGTSAADLVCHGCSPLKWLAGIHSLTTENMTTFNARTPDCTEVIYRSYTATRPLQQLPWIVRPFARHIQTHEGDNDGQVSIRSAQWGRHIRTLPCDHYEEIFRDLWLNPLRERDRFDPMPVYRNIGEWILQQ